MDSALRSHALWLIRELEATEAISERLRTFPNLSAENIGKHRGLRLALRSLAGLTGFDGPDALIDALATPSPAPERPEPARYPYPDGLIIDTGPAPDPIPEGEARALDGNR